jgi:hypothetical protein
MAILHRPLNSEDGANMILQNVRKYFPGVQHHITEELNLHKRCCENLISHYVVTL